MTDRIIQDIRSTDRRGHVRAWNTYYEGGYRDAFSVMRESLDFLTEWVEASAARRTKAVIENSARNSRFLIAVLTALSVGLGIICWSLIIAIRRPLFRLQSLLRRGVRLRRSDPETPHFRDVMRFPESARRLTVLSIFSRKSSAVFIWKRGILTVFAAGYPARQRHPGMRYR